ncbi:MAG: hypothetical protein KAR35_01625 [Candidatus Heimdallarchaeota archaeon]|nr:hypothetical protein [Candidatus Heimdallarchaeota archaeon]MCK5048054.1 hypothetical protein [Candidatus Heimdallarchaeota archaeon]
MTLHRRLFNQALSSLTISTFGGIEEVLEKDSLLINFEKMSYLGGYILGGMRIEGVFGLVGLCESLWDDTNFYLVWFSDVMELDLTLNPIKININLENVKNSISLNINGNPESLVNSFNEDLMIRASLEGIIDRHKGLHGIRIISGIDNNDENCCIKIPSPLKNRVILITGLRVPKPLIAIPRHDAQLQRMIMYTSDLVNLCMKHLINEVMDKPIPEELITCSWCECKIPKETFYCYRCGNKMN